jgi:hypothetical protein
MSLPLELLSGANADLQQIFNQFLVVAILDLRQDPKAIQQRLKS